MLEDVDAASEVVKKRDPEGNDKAEMSSFFEEQLMRMGPARKGQHHGAKGPNNASRAGGALGGDGYSTEASPLSSTTESPSSSSASSTPIDTAAGAGVASKGTTTATTAAPIANTSTADETKDTKERLDEIEKAEIRKRLKDADAANESARIAAEKFSDKLNLAGLLNVLDGIVDTPNRIVVLTTNHPKRLDPALIRPGRVDKFIYLGFMRAPEAKQMIELYFNCKLREDQYDRLKAALGTDYTNLIDLGTSGGCTPAFIEQQCAEFTEVDALLDSLEGKSNTVLNSSLYKETLDQVSTLNTLLTSNAVAGGEKRGTGGSAKGGGGGGGGGLGEEASPPLQLALPKASMGKRTNSASSEAGSDVGSPRNKT